MDPCGVVRRVDGGQAHVALVRQEACQSCGAAGFCFPSGQTHHMVLAQNRAGAGVGDRVGLALERGSVLGASASSYGLLLFGLVAGLVVGHVLGDGSDVWVGMGAGIGLAGAGFGVWCLGRLARARGWFRPVVTRIVSAGQPARG